MMFDTNRRTCSEVLHHPFFSSWSPSHHDEDFLTCPVSHFPSMKLLLRFTTGKGLTLSCFTKPLLVHYWLLQTTISGVNIYRTGKIQLCHPGIYPKLIIHPRVHEWSVPGKTGVYWKLMDINLAFTCLTVYPVGVSTSATYVDIKFPSNKFKKKTGNGDRYTPSVTDLSAACFVTFLSVFFLYTSVTVR